jgi:hypothetical protein
MKAIRKFAKRLHTGARTGARRSVVELVQEEGKKIGFLTETNVWK